jgi:hypothetical protein
MASKLRLDLVAEATYRNGSTAIGMELPKYREALFVPLLDSDHRRVAYRPTAMIAKPCPEMDITATVFPILGDARPDVFGLFLI